MPPRTSELQTEFLRVLAKPDMDKRLGGGENYLFAAIADRFPKEVRPSRRQLMSVVWSLVGQGLAYIDFTQNAPENWQLLLTDSGQAALSDEEVNPDNAGDYLASLRRKVPFASDVVHLYADEAIASYVGRRYLASAVMLGVASEAAFLEVAPSFARCLPPDPSGQYLKIINGAKQTYLAKFEEFRKRLEPFKPNLPSDLGDGLALTLDSVLDLLRVYRNDAGHPKSRRISREDCYISLQMFPRYVEKLYALKAFFDKYNSLNVSEGIP